MWTQFLHFQLEDYGRDRSQLKIGLPELPLHFGCQGCRESFEGHPIGFPNTLRQRALHEGTDGWIGWWLTLDNDLGFAVRVAAPPSDHSIGGMGKGPRGGAVWGLQSVPVTSCGNRSCRQIEVHAVNASGMVIVAIRSSFRRPADRVHYVAIVVVRRMIRLSTSTSLRCDSIRL